MVKDLTLSKASRQFLRRTTGAALVALTAFCAFAEPDVYDETTGFVTCLTTKSAGFVMDPTTWSDGVPVHNDTNYYVGVGYSAKTGDYDATSKSATFAPSLYVAGQIGTSGQASNVMIFDDLRMLPGSTLYNSSVPTWKGKMTVLTPEGSDPVTLSHNRVEYAMKLALAVVGDANARIVMSGRTAGCSMTRSGDWSGFHGTFSVRDGYTVDDSGSVFSTPGTVAFGNGGVYNQHAKAMARFGNLTFGDNATANCRTVAVENVFCTGVDCLVKVSGGSSFGTFSVGAGTAIEFQGVEPTISIAEKLAFGAGVTIVYPSQLSSVLTEADPFLPMMRLSAACVAAGLPSLDDVGVRVSGLSVGDMPKDVALAYRDGEAGGKILGVTYARMIENLQGNIQQDCSLQNHATLHRFLGGDGETDCWSGGHYPQPTDDCYSVNSLGLCNSCVPPRTLVMGKGTLYVAGGCAACDIKMLDGSLVYCRYNGSATLNGSIGLYGGSGSSRRISLRR